MKYTPEQLKEMSDHEINIAVAEKLNLNFQVSKTSGVPKECCIALKDGYGIYSVLFDPCSRWDDVMPIAENSDIWVYSTGNPVAGFGNSSHKRYYESFNKNPKRAICEVFLMLDLDS